VREIARSPQLPGQGTRDAVEDWGSAKDRIDEVVESGRLSRADSTGGYCSLHGERPA
jgi:hypothetical protein